VTQRNGYRDRVFTTAAGDLELRIPKAAGWVVLSVAGDHASSRTDPDSAERLTGIYGTDASGRGALALG
jgi:hypothetical protein